MSDRFNGLSPNDDSDDEQNDDQSDAPAAFGFAGEALPRPSDDAEPEQTTAEDMGNLFTPDLSAGEPEQRWPDYGLEMVPVQADGHDIGRRLIMQDGDFVADVSKRYKLLPNEHVLDIAEHVADDLGAVPWDQFGGDWYIEMDDHVIRDRDGRRMHALYAWDDPVEITPGDEIQLGFAVHNSIDKSLGFNVGIFTFRHACANMVWMGVNGDGMNFDDREVLEHFSHKHTKGLKVREEEVRAIIEETVIPTFDDVANGYREWVGEQVEPEVALELADRFPAKHYPEWLSAAVESIEAAAENDNVTGEEVDRDGIVDTLMPDDLDKWKLYNSFTESIWHNDRSNDRTKQNDFNDLHRVLQPAETVK